MMQASQMSPETEGDQMEVIVDETSTDDVLSFGVEAEAVMEEAEKMAEAASRDDYTAPGTGLSHGHSPDKHDSRDMLGLTNDIVAKKLMFAPNDHACPHELMARKDELVNSDVEVFSDTADTNETRWNKVRSAASSAPIHDSHHRSIEEVADRFA